MSDYEEGVIYKASGNYWFELEKRVYGPYSTRKEAEEVLKELTNE